LKSFLKAKDIMNIFSSISNGLAYLHSKHILLRNLRIENIVKLEEFNLITKKGKKEMLLKLMKKKPKEKRDSQIKLKKDKENPKLNGFLKKSSKISKSEEERLSLDFICKDE